MNGFFSPDVVLAVIAIASFALALAAAAVMLIARGRRRRAARRTLTTIRVPDVGTVLGGERYSGFRASLAAAAAPPEGGASDV